MSQLPPRAIDPGCACNRAGAGPAGGRL